MCSRSGAVGALGGAMCMTLTGAVQHVLRMVCGYCSNPMDPRHYVLRGERRNDCVGPEGMDCYGTRPSLPAHSAGVAAAGSLPATCVLGSHPWALEPAQPPPPSRRFPGGCFGGSRRLQGGCSGAPRRAGRTSVAHLCHLPRTELRRGRSGSRHRQCRRGASASQGRRRDRKRA